MAVVLAVVVLAGSQPAEAFLDALLGGLEESIGASVHQQLVQEHGVVRISERESTVFGAASSTIWWR